MGPVCCRDLFYFLHLKSPQIVQNGGACKNVTVAVSQCSSQSHVSVGDVIF